MKLSMSGLKHLCHQINICLFAASTDSLAHLSPAKMHSMHSLIFAVTEASSGIIFGDFDVNLCCNAQFAYDIQSIFRFFQLVKSATCINATSKTLIDHINVGGLSSVPSEIIN